MGAIYKNSIVYGGGRTTLDDYKIVQSRSDLPSTFTIADKKFYFCIEDDFFWFWDGTQWLEHRYLKQYDAMPTPADIFLGKVIQYIGEPNGDYKTGMFYTCKVQEGTYQWVSVNSSGIEELTNAQITELIQRL